MSHARIVCLLPARNCSLDLEGYFESTARFADAVVALDDGSLDDTGSALESQPLVKVLLRNPVRHGYAGWDDSLNRNRLLEVAADLEPDWIISIDADERLDPSDGAAVRELVEYEALPDHAYTFRVCRMVGDLNHYDLDRTWVCRLFPFRPGTSFSRDRLHFAAVPTSIHRSRWLKTTIRIQHLSGISADRRRARWEKYGEADPERRWQRSYEHLLDAPGVLKLWKPRPSDLPLLQNGRFRSGYSAVPSQDPALSQVMINMGETLHATVLPGSLPNTELIRVMSPKGRLSREHDEIDDSVDDLGAGAARRAGIHLARGDFVIFPTGLAEPTPEIVETLINSHQHGFALVTGAVVNRTNRWPMWADYFLAASRCLPGAPEGPVKSKSLPYSYLREPLVRLKEGLGDLVVINALLLERGYGAYRVSSELFEHHSEAQTIARLVRERLSNGRETVASTRRLAAVGLGPPLSRRQAIVYGPRRLLRITKHVALWGQGVRLRFVLALPLITLGCIAEWTGLVLALLPNRRKVTRVRG